MPYYRLLSDDEQTQLQKLIRVFLAEKKFEGCGGLEMTDEIRVTIAAQVCILLLNRAEFFAVITEAFFERPKALKEKHPELYEELRKFFHQDPLARLETARR